MIALPGYQILSRIYEGDRSLVYRGIREWDNRAVILKVLKYDYPPLEALDRYRHEYEIVRHLNVEGAIAVLSLETYQKTLVIVFEDFDGISLAHLYDGKMGIGVGKLSLQEFLPIAIQITEILGKIHAANVIHKDINPANIILNPQTQQVKIVDFGIATRLTCEIPEIEHFDVLEGTLAYISPEQTGRMNCCLDYRSDFYSLGVMFYQLLTGKLPFEVTDSLELIHAHIAKQPIPPHQLNPEIPQAISAIVMKLMAKIAQERYQSAWGIQADLVVCLMQLEANGVIEDIVLGEHDVSEIFQIPETLYGREEEISTLLAVFEGIATGGGSPKSSLKGENLADKLPLKNNNFIANISLITGNYGIGKSALIEVIRQPIVKRKGYFVVGEFEPSLPTPYAVLVSALRDLVRQLLTKSQAQLTVWREKLLADLGADVQAAIAIIPELAPIAGQQPVATEWDAAQIPRLLPDLIRVFVSREHPLVLCLDNLQWADSATLQLIEQIVTGTPYLWLLGAYRESDISPTHPLTTTLERLQDMGVAIHPMNLAPLSGEAVSQLLADTLHSDVQSVRPLAEVILEKTGGNPSFIREFMTRLRAENLIVFDRDRLGWHWELPQIAALSSMEKVAELATAKTLPESAPQVESTFDIDLFHAFCGGRELTALAEEISEVLTGLEPETSSPWQQLHYLLVCNLIDEVRQSFPPPTGDRVFVFLSHLYPLILSYLFGETSQALDSAARAREELDTISDRIYQVAFYFYDSLARLSACTEREDCLQTVRDNRDQLQRWAELSPDCQYQSELVEAEWCRVVGQKLEAIDGYDRAIATARNGGYINAEALACELAAKFYLAWGKETIARTYMTEAHYAYTCWGAVAKVKDIEAKYPNAIARTSLASGGTLSSTDNFGTTSTSITQVGEVLDLAAVMKAARAISEEIVLEQLLDTLMNILIENAGAQSGCLLLVEGGDLQLEAAVGANGYSPLLRRPDTLQPDGEKPLFSRAIVNYVRRTRDSVVLHDATQEGRFTQEHFVKTYQPKSILCTPLMDRGHLRGIIYLENNLATGAFTPDRLQVLQLLCAQAAIAISHAKLYERTREAEKKYRRIFENAQEGIFQTTPDGRYLRVNPALAHLYGYESPEE